jgi:S1-C subfamily serine protease
MSGFENRVLKALAIVLVPVVAGLSLYVNTLWSDYTDTDADINGYVTPKYLYGVIEGTKEATITVECDGATASGFGFRFVDEDKAEFSFDWPDQERTSVILTNYHVIKNCYQNALQVSVQDNELKIVNARILAVDKVNDIAAIWIPKLIPELEAASFYVYRPGYWVMAVGSPYGMLGTTTFGNIIYSEGNRIYTSASLNRGNSGGPLVDNVGYVMGINTGYRAVAQNLNFAIDINALCKKLANCFSNTNLLHPETDSEE